MVTLVVTLLAITATVEAPQINNNGVYECAVTVMVPAVLPYHMAPPPRPFASQFKVANPVIAVNPVQI